MLNQTIRLKTGLFMNYLVHGFGLIILTQNLINLSHNWQSSLATASFVLSGIGIGRLVAYLIMGFISDHFGRKTTLLIGISTYLAFFILTPLNHSVMLAYGLSIIAGIANSALDSATYPLLAEINKNGSSNSVMLKAFISLGEFILPIIILFLTANHLWFGLSFLVPAVILAINLINIATIKVNATKVTTEDTVIQPGLSISPIKKALLISGLFVYGYTSMAVMIWFTQWVSIFATNIGFSPVVSHLLLSLYSIGSITGVITVVILLKKFNIKKLLFLILNAISVISITTISFSNIEQLSAVAAFCFGFSAAGGLMQIALNTLLSVFPKHKGIFTGLFFIFGSLASFSVPIITGMIVKTPHANVLAGDIIIAIIGLIVAIIMFVTLPNPNDSLADARSEINRIDTKLIQLLEQRFAAVNDVYKFKQTNQVAIKDLSREQQVLQNVANQTTNKELVKYNQSIIQNIMDNAKKYQSSLK